jgi:hypothetical protein
VKLYMTPVLSVVLLATACAPITAVSGKLALEDHGIEIDIPAGWNRIELIGRNELVMAGFPFEAILVDQNTEAVLLTRDGLLLQAIRIERVPVDNELLHSKRKLAAGMPAHDVAELEVDDLRSNPQALNFELVENQPAIVAGRPGFRLVYRWKTKQGLALQAIHYGLFDGKVLYRIVYQAARRHYFQRDAPVFERVRESLRLIGTRT